MQGEHRSLYRSPFPLLLGCWKTQSPVERRGFSYLTLLPLERRGSSAGRMHLILQQASREQAGVMETLAKNLQLTIDGCRRLLKERSDPRELETLQRILENAQTELAELTRQQEEKRTRP